LTQVNKNFTRLSTLIYKLRKKMKKLLSLISLIFLITTISAKAEIGIGISGAIHMLDASGSETTRQSNQNNSGSHEETVEVPEIFIEAVNDNGLAVGISYIPTRDMGSKSRTDTSTGADAAAEADTGTYTASAELDNVIKLYTDLPTGKSIAGGNLYVHLGLQHVELVTLESLNSGAVYPNKNLLGATLGLGIKGDIPYGNNLYYKGELSYTNFETYKADGAGNKVSAQLEDYAARLSVGYKF
jgi:hypothetical protein